MKEIGMAMLYTKKSPNDIKVENDLDLFKYIPDDVMERN